MAMIPHVCRRFDCKHNFEGICRFYVGDLYYSICIDTGSNYTPKTIVTENGTTLNENGEITW